ncbi:putative glycoside hydrolase [Aquabacterium sp.]|uniref:putative glycoside hydrolase n=1 Tax=Aquabacterium sp. TaxID=1872578 RepID=UPI0035B45122
MTRLFPLLATVLSLALSTAASARTGLISNASTKAPIADAVLITSHQVVLRSNERGQFEWSDQDPVVAARAVGYRAVKVANSNAIELTPFTPKALYLSHYGIGDRGLRGDAVELIEHTELNALVIDFKGDRGLLPYHPAGATAETFPWPHQATVGDLPGLIKELKAKGIYLIARIVVFKDDPLAHDHPELAVKTSAGNTWKDREDLAWVDPFQKAVWDYNIAIAENAAQLGFDEIQFDYVRFPDATQGPVFSEPSTADARVKAITGFLKTAYQRLTRYNVFVSADIFGYVCWNENDTGIGQDLDALKGAVDILAPMLYPSGFTWGIPGHANPVAAPDKIVGLSLQRARQRTGLPGVAFRPWLQAFRDYAFDHREFGAEQIKAQIDAAQAAGSDGWMLWNARNRYSAEGLHTPQAAATTPAASAPASATP